MRLLDLVIKEYLSIINSLIDTEGVEKNRIIIDKLRFKELLEKYKYIEFRQKTKIYKNLGLIIHDENNYTLPCKDVEQKKTVRKFVFNYDTYLTVKNLYETEINL